MSSLFDDVMMGARAADLFFKGAKKVGKLAKDGIQKLNESEKFQEMKADLQDKITNSETLHNLKAEVQQRVSQFGEAPRAAEKRACPQCGAMLDVNARFCSSCGAAQEQPVNQEPTSEEAPQVMHTQQLGEEPEVYEARPTVLENDDQGAEVLFDL